VAIGQKMEEQDMVAIMLKILPCAYEHFIETMNITFTSVDLEFDALFNRLLHQDKGRNSSIVVVRQRV
jgi:hypothetical protein